MKTRMAGLAMGGAALAVSAALLVAAPQGISLAATPIQSAVNFQSLANSDLLVSGPVQQVNAKSFQIRVLGQTATVPAAQHQLFRRESSVAWWMSTVRLRPTAPLK